jgi:hypothetical protein
VRRDAIRNYVKRPFEDVKDGWSNVDADLQPLYDRLRDVVNVLMLFAAHRTPHRFY